jgi:hypothetical protein
MAHTKLISPYGWSFDERIVTPVKFCGRGLVGHDRQEFVKRASGSESIFLPALEKMARYPDEELVHLIACGAFERWGFNRNGDGFKEAACRDYCDTFEKYAHPFRSHKNKIADGDPYFGVIKKAAYNPVMKRVELIVGYNKTKSATDRNGGLVADRELEKLARGEDLAVSMACRVPDDACSYCGHRARNRDEYCTAEKCAAGGCKDNLTRLVKVGNDLHHMGVFNDRPYWFDISDVFRPACRTCYGGKADWLTKTASDHADFGVGGARAAADLGVYAPLAVFLQQAGLIDDRRVAGQIKLAYALDDLRGLRGLAAPPEALRAFEAAAQPGLDLDGLGLTPDAPRKMAEALGALADEKVVLPMREFARMTKRAELAEPARSALPGVYGRMLADGTLEGRVERNRYAPAEAPAERRYREKAAEARATHGLGLAEVNARAARSVVRGRPAPKSAFEKSAAAVSPAAEELARDYAVYKLAALERIAGSDTEFLQTAQMAAAQDGMA